LFQNDRYITRGIKALHQQNPLVMLYLWQLIDEMDVQSKDYLQVFVMRNKFWRRQLQEIEHSQEEPPYKVVHRFYTERPLEGKIYVLDDGENTTMLLADEY